VFASYVATVLKMRSRCSQESAPYLFSKFNVRFQHRLAVVLFFHRFALLRGAEMDWPALSKGVYDSFARDIRNFVIGDRGAAVMYAVAYDDGLPDELRLSGISRSSKAFKAAVDEEYFLHRPAAAEAEVWHFFPEEEENEQEQDEEEDLEEALEEEEELEEQEQQEEQEHEEEH
jgi:hypothetical protein